MENRVININPEILGGTPVFYGTRVPIKNLFDYLETGESIDEFLSDFEGVGKDQVVKVLEMSHKFLIENLGETMFLSCNPVNREMLLTSITQDKNGESIIVKVA